MQTENEKPPGQSTAASLHAIKSLNSHGSASKLAIGVLSLLNTLSTISKLKHRLGLCTMGNFALGRCLKTKYSTRRSRVLYLVSSHLPSAKFPVVHEPNRCFNLLIVDSMFNRESTPIASFDAVATTLP